MNFFGANIINGIVLILIGMFGVMVSASISAWIAPSFGLLLLLFSPFLKKENIIVEYIVTALTVGFMLMLIVKPLTRAIIEDPDDHTKLARIITLIVSCLAANLVFIRKLFFYDKRP